MPRRHPNIEFDMSRTNLHPDLNTPDVYQIQISAGMIKITVKDCARSSIKLMTSDGDFLDFDLTQGSRNQISVSFHKPESITGGSIERVELTGDYLIEVKKIEYGHEYKKTILVNVRR